MRHLRTIDRLEALRALSEPQRMEILRRILASPQTISSLGVVMERHPAWIRHHVKALEAAGLVELAEERTTRNYTEKFYAATAPAFAVSMFVRPGMGEDSRIVAMVSDDFAIEALAEDPGHRVNLSAAVTGSLDGLMGLRQGFADVAGCHLLDTDTGEYNIPYVRHFFPDRDIVITTVAHREQGLLVAPGNPLALRSLEDVVEKQARFVNRNPGSGTRIWLDRRLSALGIPSESVRGYSDVVDTHRAAARRVAAGYADAAVGVALAAESHGLDFVALFEERYDLVMTEEAHQTVEIARFIDRIQDRAFKRTVGSLSGYDNSATGDERLVKL